MNLTCPNCTYSAPADAFIPEKLDDWFAPRAFGLLLFVVVLGLLHAVGSVEVEENKMDIVLATLVLSFGFALGAAYGEWRKEKELKKKILSKENVLACFGDVDWNRQVFTANGTTMRASDGCTHFYKVHSIDDAIKRLNELLNASPAREVQVSEAEKKTKALE